jgi:hypothetical protein
MSSGRRSENLRRRNETVTATRILTEGAARDEQNEPSNNNNNDDGTSIFFRH